ncbi:MAG: FtsX-like permease family protein, partial [Acidobacteria bacterium]|nr:FtsX-like permease family protein [Acidobacteriota bacterium]
VTFAILLVAANTMAMSVRERIKEVGVLKTLGFTTGKVLTMIVAEAVIIAMIGGVLGCLLAVGLMGWAAKMPLIFGAGIRMPAAAAAINLVVALLIGLASSVVPAWNAARLPIADALRHTG